MQPCVKRGEKLLQDLSLSTRQQITAGTNPDIGLVGTGPARGQTSCQAATIGSRLPAEAMSSLDQGHSEAWKRRFVQNAASVLPPP